MKNIFFILLFSFLATATFAQEFASHNVKKGETIYSIAEQYGISESLLYQLNPDVKNGIKTGDFLIVPSQGSVVLEDLKKHRVKRKETIKSIALKYNITEDDLKKYNKDLYAREVKKGKKIDIPVFEKNSTGTINTNTEEVIEEAVSKHAVLPKETKFGIARKYGISIAELEQLNPTMGESLQIGQEIMVPNLVVSEDGTTIEEDDFEYYEVLPKEGFFRLKIKLGLSEEEIVALNPYAKEGLKEGMIIKIPKNEILNPEEFTAVNLEDHITNYKVKNIAVMLPFKLNQIDLDSSNVNKELLKSDGTLRAAVDFYSGVLMASEFAKDHGISTNITIYDTEGSINKVETIISSNNFDDVDAVIGPLLSKNIERTASILQSKNIPVFSPLSKVKIKSFPNLYQTMPSTEMMQKAMLDYIIKHKDTVNVIVISGKEWTKQKGVIMTAIPDAKTIVPKEGNYLYVESIKLKLDVTKENWIILASDNPILVSNVVGLLNGFLGKIISDAGFKPNEINIRLFAVNKNKAFEYNDVSNLHLANLDFTFPSVNKHYDYEVMSPFLVSYKNKYNVMPTKHAIRGFDVTYDVLLRLANAETLEEASNSEIKTEYIENKFQYNFSNNKGYSNKAFYIMKYNKDLKLVVEK
ncbi:MAG: LysM peptidoglycan-binding domain-containing protein [Flavobacteriaceae bacterium]|nr:LysM peptidoglycan-binding domain-containing protein [Flavobacteriaceae bacterium]